MCVFKEENFGKPLPPSMIEFISRYTTKKDREDIARKANCSESLVKQVANGSLNLSRTNAEAIRLLMQRCVENCGNMIVRAKIDHSKFKKILDHG